MDLKEYLETMISEAIENEKSMGLMPYEFDFTAEDYGWNVVDKSTGTKIDIILDICD